MNHVAFQRILNISDLEIVVKGGSSYSPLGIKMKGIKEAKKIKKVIEKCQRETKKGGKNEVRNGDL